MFRIATVRHQYIELFRNIYKFKRYFLLGVVEFEYKSFFYTLQLPLSSLYQEENSVNLGNKKQHMVFIIIGYVRECSMSTCCLQTQCFQCCIKTNMILTYRDIESIKQIGYARQFFVTEHDGWLQLKNHKGRCVFHNGTKCTIYSQRPEGCRLYPVVYNKDDKSVLLDDECPQKHCFVLSKTKVEQITTLVSLLEQERKGRTQKEDFQNK